GVIASRLVAIPVVVGPFLRSFMAVRSLWVTLSVELARKVTASKELRLPVYFREVHHMGNHDYFMVTPMKADGQSLNLQVDTGSDKLFFLEKGFLERTLRTATCEDYIFGCYECRTDLCSTEFKENMYCDGTCAYTVQHRGTLELGGR
ncbi:hypothetical protein FOZ63_020472, partial [Perkinsus olseni]